MDRKKLILVDGHSLAYRAFHALPADMQTSTGELSNASYGFTMMLISVLEAEDPDYVVVAFDKGPSFRARDYAEYKAHREKMPQEMRSQMSRIHEIVDAFGFPIVELPDFEADDVLGTLSLQAAKADIDVVIVTGDRDALQLVDGDVTVLTSGRRFSDTIHYTPASVHARYNLRPDQLVDLKALVGDKSDNIPGVRGVGEKGAVGMLQQYDTLDGIYAHLDELSPRYQKALDLGRKEAYLSQHLGLIVRDAPVDFDIVNADRNKGLQKDKLIGILQEIGFRTLIRRLLAILPDQTASTGQQLSMFDEASDSTDSPPSLGQYHSIESEDALIALCAQLKGAPVIAFDTETTGTDSMAVDLVGISMTANANEAWYIPVLAPDGEPRLPLSVIQKHLGPILASEKSVKQGHNLKYDIKVLARYDLIVKGPLFDSMVAEWILNPDSHLGLKNQAWVRLGIQMTEIKELIGSGRDQKTMDQVPLRQVVPYAGADADMTYRLSVQLKSELENKQQYALFNDLEMALLPVLIEMELTGIQLNPTYLRELSKEFTLRLDVLEQSIYQSAGKTFNVNSTQQLSSVLFDELRLSTRGIRKMKSGFYSTRAQVLEGLHGTHPIVDAILAYRELSKLKSTYVDALPSLINPHSGRVHTTYNPVGTVTGRISSNNPNLQNIPIRTEEGRRVRKAFVAAPGWCLVGADYSQVELRVMAHVSQDEGLRGAFARNEDVHATTAAAVYDVPLEAVTYDMRRIAKAVNFGLIYGQSAFGLAGQIGVRVEEAQDFITRYFNRFPLVRTYMNRMEEEASTQGYVETLLKRRRYFPELSVTGYGTANQRQAAQRMAINTPIQGSAADIIKLAMIRLYRMLKSSQLQARMLLQVHDEIVLEVPEAEVDDTEVMIRDAMENAFDLAVPLKVDIEVGSNWQDMA